MKIILFKLLCQCMINDWVGPYVVEIMAYLKVVVLASKSNAFVIYVFPKETSSGRMLYGQEKLLKKYTGRKGELQLSTAWSFNCFCFYNFLNYFN